jgi:hypothetical protein
MSDVSYPVSLSPSERSYLSICLCICSCPAQGPSLGALARLERSLLSRWGASHLGDLTGGGPCSLVMAAAEDPDLMAAIMGYEAEGGATPGQEGLRGPSASAGGGSGVGGGAPVGDVVAFLAQALTAALGGQAIADSTATAGGAAAEVHITPEVRHALRRAVCQQFGVRHVEDLGHGSLTRLVQLGIEAARSAAHRAVPCALALSVGPRSSAMSDGTTGLPNGTGPGTVSAGYGGEVSRASALSALASAPPLADLHHWCQWGPVFEPTLGRLEDFLKAEGTAAGVLALSLPRGPAASSAGPVLELPCGRLIKLPAESSVELYVEAVTQ